MLNLVLENKQITLQKYWDTENSWFNQNTQQIEKNNQSINDAFIVTRRDIKEGGKKERLTYGILILFSSNGDWANFAIFYFT